MTVRSTGGHGLRFEQKTKRLSCVRTRKAKKSMPSLTVEPTTGLKRLERKSAVTFLYVAEVALNISEAHVDYRILIY